MPDAARLPADAEQAAIRSEMARSQLQAAKRSLRRRDVRWAAAQGNRSVVRSKLALARSGPAGTGD